MPDGPCLLSVVYDCSAGWVARWLTRIVLFVLLACGPGGLLYQPAAPPEEDGVPGVFYGSAVFYALICCATLLRYDPRDVGVVMAYKKASIETVVVKVTGSLILS